MNALRAIILLAFVGVLSIPFLLRAGGVGAAGGDDAVKPADANNAERLIVVTPHIEQIRIEFARAFSAWHQARYGKPVDVDYRTPGGTTEILQLLQAQYADRIQSGRIKADGSCEAGVIDFDVMFGGGSYDLGRLKAGVKAKGPDGKEVSTPMSTPPPGEKPGDAPGLSMETLKRVFGEATVPQVAEYLAGGGPGRSGKVDGKRAADVDKELRRRFAIKPGDDTTTIPNVGIGAGYLYDLPDAGKSPPDPGQYWIGTALSGFGIIYNRDRLRDLGNVPEPVTFELLRDFRFFNQLALADPRQSGSVATAYDSILNESARAAAAKGEARDAGWSHGWDTLRDIVANARYFTSASTQPPLDVSQGEAAAGIAIDFYGRYQAQALLKPGQSAGQSRMGYVDPAGAVYIDADPVSVLRGGPNPTVARRFVEFCLTPEAQSLWQFPPRRGASSTEAGGAGVSPVPTPAIGGTGVSPVPSALGPWEYRLRRLPVMRSMYDPKGPYFAHLADQVNPFAIASSATVQGWRDGMIVMFGCWIDAGEDMRRAWKALNNARIEKGRSAADLAEMERLFYAMPKHTLKDGSEVEFGPATYKQISDDVNRWRDPVRGTRAKIAYTKFFKDNWRRVAELGDQ